MALLPIAAVHAQTIPDFSGIWRSNANEIETLHRVDRGPVTWGPIPYLTTTEPYTIEITQDSLSLTLAFPGGDRNFMNAGAYSLSGDEVASIADRGEWWVKTITGASRESAGVVVLEARRLTGWWKSARPAEVVSQEAETDTVFALRLDAEGTALVVETTFSDEKGRVTYRQAFHRN